jgi:hypothetical protein
MNARGVGRWLCMLVDSRDGWSLADSRGLSRTLSRARRTKGSNGGSDDRRSTTIDTLTKESLARHNPMRPGVR